MQESMMLSVLINRLQKALDQHGDKPVYTEDADISRVEIVSTNDGTSSWTNGELDAGKEFTLLFHPA